MKFASDAPAFLFLCGNQPLTQGSLKIQGPLALFHHDGQQNEGSRSEEQEQHQPQRRGLRVGTGEWTASVDRSPNGKYRDNHHGVAHASGTKSEGCPKKKRDQQVKQSRRGGNRRQKVDEAPQQEKRG